MKKFLLKGALALVLVTVVTAAAVAPYAERRLAAAVADVIRDELVAACPACELSYGSSALSLLAPGGTFGDVVVREGGVPKLTIEKVSAGVGLGLLARRVILLDPVVLSGVHADGVSEESVLFRFIDRLTAPPPPGTERPDRWRARLEKLVLERASFAEPLGARTLRGEGVGLTATRGADGSFALVPSAERLSLVAPGKPGMTLGRVDGSLVIREGTVEWETVRLRSGDAYAALTGVSDGKAGNALKGAAEFAFDAASVGLGSYLSASLAGAGVLSGTLGSPVVTGSFGTRPGERLAVSNGGLPVLSFSEFSAPFSVDVNRGKPVVTAGPAEGAGPAAELLPGTKVTVSGDRIEGSLGVALRRVDAGPVAAEGVTVRVEIKGPTDAPDVSVTAEAADLFVAGAGVGPATARARIGDGRSDVSLEVERPDGTASFEAEGAVKHDGDSPEIERLTFEATDLRFVSTDGPTILDSLRVSGSGTVSGPPDLRGLSAEAEADVGYRSDGGDADLVGLRGRLELSDGVLTVRSRTADGSVTPTARLDLLGRGPSTLSVEADKLPLGAEGAGRCGDVTLTADYSFRPDAFLRGDGKITIAEARYGCAPYAVTLAGTPSTVPIKAGVIALEGLSLSGADTSVALRGVVSLERGYDLGASGSVGLATFAREIPTVDDLGGTVSADVTVRGPLGSPLVKGSATLSGGELSAEAADVAASGVSGTLHLDDGVITATDVRGELNTGRVEISGRFDAADPGASSAAVRLEDVLLEPSAGLSVVASGALGVSVSPQSTPVVRGKIEIENAEFQRSVDFRSVLDAALKIILPGGRTSSPEVGGTTGGVELDVTVTADRGLFVTTQWLEAELKANLAVTGTSSDPKIQGELETISGWFGMREKRFDVTSGKIAFKPYRSLPSVDVTAESSLASRTGEPVSVVLEARGPLDDPKVTFTSDRGLSQQEVLGLLTGTPATQDFAPTRRFGIGLSYSDLSLVDREDPTRGSRFLSDVTRIDSISLEPSYNSLTGTVEPTVVAHKRISEDLELVGEGRFAGAVTGSRVELEYSLAEPLTLSGVVETLSIQQQTGFGVDLAYTILSPHRRYLEVTLRGNESFGKGEILSAARVKDTSRIPTSSVKDVSARLEEKYADEGFPAARVRTTCAEVSGDCRAMTIEIVEGERTRVASVELEGEGVESLFTEDELDEFRVRTYATEAFREKTSASILVALRRKGYLAAKVRARYEAGAAPDERRMIVSVDAGRPVLFNFVGNERFSAEELLATVDLLGRKHPFGSNSARILAREIEGLYRRTGYLFASVDVTRHDAPGSGRTDYTVTVREERPAGVSGVKFEGLSTLDPRRLRRILRRADRARTAVLLSPTAAVAEEIESHAAFVATALREAGFPEAAVTGDVRPSDDGTDVEVVYRVSEGPRLAYDSVDVTGLPDGVALPSPPPPPVSVPQADRYAEGLSEGLKEAGYFYPDVAVRAEGGVLSVSVSPGDRASVGYVSVTGNERVSADDIKAAFGVAEGDPWNAATIDAGRRSLLRRGLFSRVTAVPADGAADGPVEDLVISVFERSLRSLRVGAGLNSQFGFHLFGDATDRALFADGRSFSLRTDLFYDAAEQEISRGTANLVYTVPEVLGSPFSFVEDLGYQNLQTVTQEFDVERASLSSYAFHSFENGLTTSFGHSLSAEVVSDVSPDAVLGPLDTGNVKLSVVSGETTYDRRDDPLNPKRGYTVGAQYRVASDALGSDADFASGLLRGSLVLPGRGSLRRFSLFLSARAGLTVPFGDTDVVPITQRFYLGGRNTVRGFQENSLGPRGALGSVLGGDVLQSNSAQLRYLLTESFSVHGFLDAGNVYLRDRSVDLKDQRYGAGVGVSYLSPIGPVGVDVGVPLDREGDEDRWRLHFAIGTNF